MSSTRSAVPKPSHNSSVRGHPPWRERLLSELAPHVVGGRVGDREEARIVRHARGESLVELVPKRGRNSIGQGLAGHLRREGLGVAERDRHVLIAGDEPQAHRVGAEDRRVLPRHRVGRVRVPQFVGRERVIARQVRPAGGGRSGRHAAMLYRDVDKVNTC
jgi:hypothetical protein